MVMTIAMMVLMKVLNSAHLIVAVPCNFVVKTIAVSQNDGNAILTMIAVIIVMKKVVPRRTATLEKNSGL